MNINSSILVSCNWNAFTLPSDLHLTLVNKKKQTKQNLAFTETEVSVANEWVSKVLQRVNKKSVQSTFYGVILFIIYIRPISCNKPSK